MASNLAILSLDEIKASKCPVCQSNLTWTSMDCNLVSDHCNRIFTATLTNMTSNSNPLWRVVETYYELI